MLALPLLAAAPNVFYSKPTVIVYPFTSTTTTIDREASARLATIIATQMGSSGKVVVKPPPPETERKDYLTVARTQGADYYVSGYISALGTGVSVVEQVVSTTTGIVVYSQSTQLVTYQDAAGQGDDLATYISNHANRGLASVPSPPPQTSPSPVPSNGPEANLSRLFGRRKAASTPAPKPAPSAPAAALTNVTSPAPAATRAPATVAQAPSTATTPASALVVLPVEGAPDAALRQLAEERVRARTGGERAASATAACSGRTPRAVLSGILAVKPNAGNNGGSAIFELAAKSCGGEVLWRQSRSSEAAGPQGVQTAVERAVDAAVEAYLNPPKARRR